MPIRIDSEPVASFEALETLWRAFEARVSDLSFFQSWTWVGCLASERYGGPVLLRAEQDGQLVGLALFNRHRGRLYLTESGEPELDAPFTEHNAPLIAPEASPDVLPALLRAAQKIARGRLVLGGVPASVFEAVEGRALRMQVREAPFVDLDVVRQAGGDPLVLVSANTRYQVRRSLRRQAENGSVSLERAGTEAEALVWLDNLIELHTRRWQSRGRPGAFANPFVQRFHRALVARAMTRDEVDLLRFSGGSSVFGYLYNFRLRGLVATYQSGFDPANADGQRKPGIVAHVLAIRRAAALGEQTYDFLAGADRYKRSLATGSRPLVWAEVVPSGSLAANILPFLRAIRDVCRRCWPGRSGSPQ